MNNRFLLFLCTAILLMSGVVRSDPTIVNDIRAIEKQSGFPGRLDQFIKECEDRGTYIEINSERSTNSNDKLTFGNITGFAIVAASALIKYNFYNDYENIDEPWRYFWMLAALVDVTTRGCFTILGTTRAQEYLGKLRRGEMKCRELGFLAVSSIYGLVSSGFDGYRIMTEACPGGVSFGCGLLGVPEILSVFFTVFESFHLFFAHHPSKYWIVSSGRSELIQGCFAGGSQQRARTGNQCSHEPLHVGENDFTEQNSGIELEGATRSTVGDSESIQVEVPAEDIKVYLIKEGEKSKSCQSGSYLLSLASSYFLITMEQATTLYTLVPEANYLDHLCKMISMGGHFLGNIFLEGAAINEIAEYFMRSNKSHYEVSEDQAKKIIAKAQCEQILVDQKNNNSKKKVPSSNKEKIFAMLGVGVRHAPKAVGITIGAVGSFAGSGHYQLSVSSRILDCVTVQIEGCLREGKPMSVILNSPLENWQWAKNYLGWVLPRSPEDFTQFLSREEIAQNATTGVLGITGANPNATIDLALEAMNCPSVHMPCKSESFLYYQTATALGNIIGIIPTGLRAFAVYREREALYDIVRRFRNTLHYCCRSKCKKGQGQSAVYVNKDVLPISD